MEALLEPARAHAAAGFAASESLAAASRQLSGVVGADDFTGGGPLHAGQVVRRPGVARALAAIARDGRSGFYEGECGHALLELGRGEYTAADFSRRHADWVQPLELDAFGRTLWSLPPNSQGYILLRCAAIASTIALPEPEHPRWAHLLIEACRESAADRDSAWHEGSDGAALIAPARIGAMRARISEQRAGSSRAAAVPGGTVSLCVVDAERMSVSMLQSNVVGWGAMLFVLA